MENDGFVDSLPWMVDAEIYPHSGSSVPGNSLESEETREIEIPVHLPESLAGRVISLSDQYPEIDFLLKKDGTGCISLGDIIVLKGKAKAGKTTVILCLVTAVLRGDYVGFISLKLNIKVMYVDTEQNPLNTRIFCKKLHALCGYSDSEDHPQFHALNLRGDTPAERRNLIKQAVEYFKPDLLVIDGAKDLIDNVDINDPKTSGQTMQFLMTLTKDHNLALLTTLHENKGDSNLRGHIGSELLNKCSEAWQVRKYEDVFEVSQTDCRNESVSGFSFRFDDEKLPVQVEDEPRKSAAQTADEKMKKLFSQCLPDGVSLRYKELKNKYIESASCCANSAENHITKAVKLNYLLKDNYGNYSFNYPTATPRYPNPNTPTPYTGLGLFGVNG